MKKIDNDIIQTILGLLDKHKGTLWDSYYWELQDGGVTLFIRIKLLQHPSEEQLQTIRNILVEILHPRLPQNQKFYSWAVSIFHEEKQIDAVMGGIGNYVV
jgi:hypothetical protein